MRGRRGRAPFACCAVPAHGEYLPGARSSRPFLVSAPRLPLAEPQAPHVPEPIAARGPRITVAFVIDNMRLGGTELNAVRTAERLMS